MAYAFDAAANFAVSSVSTGYTSAATQIVLADGDPNLDQWPDPATNPYNVVWWDGTNYPGGPADDPLREIVRATAWNLGTRTMTITRAQEGTSAVNHNTAGATYKVALVVTAKLVTDLESAAVDTGSAYGWVTDYGAVGDGATDDKAAFDAAAAALTHIVVPSGTYRFASGSTFGTGVTWQLLQGAVIAPDVGITVTINGPLQAGNYEIWGGTGTLTFGDRAKVEQKSRWLGSSADDYYQLPVSSLRLGVIRIGTGTVKPSSGTWETGDIVLNADPAVQEYLGWACTAGGTPGTWKGFAPIDGDVVVESAELDFDGGGAVTCAIAHGLSYTPAAKDISLTVYQTAGPDDLTLRQLVIDSVDGTNINVYVYRTTTIPSNTNKGKVAARIRMVTQ